MRLDETNWRMGVFVVEQRAKMVLIDTVTLNSRHRKLFVLPLYPVLLALVLGTLIARRMGGVCERANASSQLATLSLSPLFRKQACNRPTKGEREGGNLKDEMLIRRKRAWW